MTRGGRPAARGRMRGLSMVELMVALVLGLLVVAAGGTIVAASISGSRRGMVEARLAQDVRSAMDVVEREVRRAGYWSNATAGGVNPYGGMAVSNSNAQLAYAYASKALDNTVSSTESFSIRLLRDNSAGTSTLQIQRDNQGAWESLTDPDTVRITSFSIVPDANQTRLLQAVSTCSCTCSVATPAPVCPGALLRVFQIQITGVSQTDATLSKSMSSTVRVRNDQFQSNVCSACP